MFTPFDQLQQLKSELDSLYFSFKRHYENEFFSMFGKQKVYKLNGKLYRAKFEPIDEVGDDEIVTEFIIEHLQKKQAP